MKRRVTKVKYKSDTVEIYYEDEVNQKTEAEAHLTCAEQPHPDFTKAFVALEADVYHILQLPEDWRRGQMRVTQVSFSESDGGVKGVVLTGTVHLETSNAPFNFNTPHIPYEQYSQTGDAPIMPGSSVERLTRVEAEALAYIKGKRAQLDLLDGDE